MKKINLDIVGLSYSQTQSGAYALVLGEVGGNRRLPIIIGGFEAQAIAVEIEKMTPSRPLTHDLFKAFADAYKITLQEVIIYNLIDGIFFAKLICSDGEKISEIDARTSDAIALAVRFDAPIFTYEFIMASAGIVIESNDFAFLENIESVEAAKAPQEPRKEIPTPQKKSPYSSLSDEQLETALEKAIADEQYETAAAIRDEITYRKSSS
ncbi:bifunctional nuclease domain-containing protein [Sphingobacterium spiritivorum]|uniref:bifunctional nuclease domain-containing protein n=1 Tax=Sphingobacterium spiritivorum TaxID=258 RepID=UPI003DA3D781